MAKFGEVEVNMKSLVESPFWQPMENKLNEMLNGYLNRLKYCDAQELKTLQGAIHVLETLLALPVLTKMNNQEYNEAEE